MENIEITNKISLPLEKGEFLNDFHQESINLNNDSKNDRIKSYEIEQLKNQDSELHGIINWKDINSPEENKESENKLTEENLQFFTCGICEESKEFNEIILMKICSDFFCKYCLNEYLKIRILESNVLRMPCPNHLCIKEVPEDIIESTINSQLFQKYLFFKRNEELSNCPYLRWCPTPDCTGYDIGGLNKQLLMCNVCKFNYCYYCLESWHEGKKCKANNEKELDKWSRKHGVKYCPNCRRRIEKKDGCDHMWNPPILTIITMFFFPIILFIAPIVGCIFSIEKMIDEPGSSIKLKKILRIWWLSYPGAFLIGVILTPIYLASGPFIGSISLAVNLFKGCMDNCILVSFFGFILGLIGTPILIALSITIAIILHITSWIFILIKLYVVIRRCIEPTFLLPRYGAV